MNRLRARLFLACMGCILAGFVLPRPLFAGTEEILMRMRQCCE